MATADHDVYAPLVMDALKKVEVTAPATLDQGYTLTASVRDGRLFNVTVVRKLWCCIFKI
jgi:hypothetical protein